MANWPQIRARFPSLKGWTYLDTASFGQLPQCASAAIQGHLVHREETASSQFLTWFDDMDEIRASCAQLIQCQAADIAFVPSASTGLAFLMQGLNWQRGDEILTLEDEFPNQLYQSAPAERAGVVFRKVAWADFYTSVNERTRLVMLSTVNYATGFRPRLFEISSSLRSRNILLYLDGTQSVGALKINVSELRPSILCVDAYKWLMSPNGAGFVYFDPELRERLIPTVVGWRSDRGWRQVNHLNHGTPVFAKTAQKFEGGMLPFASLYGMGAVIQLLLNVGLDEVEARVLDLAARTRRMLVEMGGEVNADHSQIVTARLNGHDCSLLVEQLKAQRILVSARHGKLRISPHFYNDEQDIERLQAALSAAVPNGRAVCSC